MPETPQGTTPERTSAPQGGEPATSETSATPADTNPADGQQVDKASRTGKGNSEAAKYRTRLREAEADRDQLRTEFEAARSQLTSQIDTAREIILNSHLESIGVRLKTSGLAKLGYNPADLVDDKFAVNSKALEATLQEISDSGFEIKATISSSTVKKSGTGGVAEASGGGWGDVINKK